MDCRRGVCVCAWHSATSPDQLQVLSFYYLLLMSSESLMSLREQRLLFRVLPVLASVRPPANSRARVHFTCFHTGQGFCTVTTVTPQYFLSLT